MKRAVPAERGLLRGCQDSRRGMGEMPRGIYLGADPKVTELHLAPGVHQHVGGLHICGGKNCIIHFILDNKYSIYNEYPPLEGDTSKSSSWPCTGQPQISREHWHGGFG